MFNEGGKFMGYRGVASNITEKRRTEMLVRELAEYDFLTGLPNRMLLGARFEFALRQAKRRGAGVDAGMSLMFMLRYSRGLTR